MAESSKNGTFAFDNFKLDTDKLMLYRDGDEVLIPAKIAKTLTVLVESAGSILSKDEMIDRVWDDSIVEESNLTQYLYRLRKILGNMPDGRPYIETLRRRGYRFNGDVTKIRKEGAVKPAVAREPETLAILSGVERVGNVLRVVDWQNADEASPVVRTPEHDAKPRRSIYPRLAIGAVALLIAAAAAGVAFIGRQFKPVATKAEAQLELSITRLTNGAVPGGATISPDGNYFVYHELDGDVVRMFVQQTGQASRIEIVSSTDKVHHAKTFAPDGQSIYYVATGRADGAPSLFRVPTIGGPSVKILDSIDGPVSFSPDGKEMVFRRLSRSTSGESELVIADKDGRTERILLQRRNPKILASSPAWSPGGKIIAFAEVDVYDQKGRANGRIRAVTVATGEVTPISEESWDTIYRTVWMPDGDGLVTVATRENESYSTRRDQVYYISYPDGVSHRITSEGNRHEPDSLGVTKAGAILAVPGNRSSQIWSLTADGDEKSAIQITKGTADGRAGLGPLPDGRIGYLARTADELNLLVSNGDGSNPKQLPSGFPFVEELRADPSGKFFVFSTMMDSRNHLYRINAVGGDVKQLTFGDGNEIDSTISPDGRSVVTDSVVFQNNVPKISLIKIPSEGGEPRTLATGCSLPTFSPDGSMLSCINNGKPEIVVLSAADGTEIERHPLPTFASWNFGVGWTPDGAGLIYIGSENGSSNLWIQLRSGGKPVRLTNFSSGVIYRYAFSPNGSRLFVARGYPVQDAILIKDFR